MAVVNCLPSTEKVQAAVSLADVISAMSYALDITEGQPEGHATRSCLIAMRIAEEINLPVSDRSSLFYGTLIKDAGCSSNAAKVCALFGADDRAIKRSFKINDLTNKVNALSYMMKNVSPDQSLLTRAAKIMSLIVQPSAGRDMIQTRCSRGADIAHKMGFPNQTADTIRALDEHWNGGGEPYGLQGEQIPLLGRIACLVQTVEVYFSTYSLATALDIARERSGKWFDPQFVKALLAFQNDTAFWQSINTPNPRAALATWEPEGHRLMVDDQQLDAIAEGFADVIDAKSPWTSRHSYGVANAMVGILKVLGYQPAEIRYWRRAALLHDIGKLGVSNTILDKAGKLTEDEFSQMKGHVNHTRRILSLVPCFDGFADEAAAHHEKLDGSGYSLGLTENELSIEARVLCVADIFDALSAKRPYRDQQLSLDEVFSIMSREAGPKICPIAFDALKHHIKAQPSDLSEVSPAVFPYDKIGANEEQLLLSLESSHENRR